VFGGAYKIFWRGKEGIVFLVGREGGGSIGEGFSLPKEKKEGGPIPLLGINKSGKTAARILGRERGGKIPSFLTGEVGA